MSYAANEIAGWIENITPEVYGNAINKKIMIVAEEQDGIVGLGILDLEQKEIGAVYVHPAVKGRGVGRSLLSELEAIASKNDIDRLTLCSTVNAHGFYRHYGYIGEEKEFHKLPNGVRLKCVRMYKTLSK